MDRRLLPRPRVRKLLQEIEEQRGCEVFYAVESGSRAWGFPSQDSDYDVRFLYKRDLGHYLSIDVENRRDVIEKEKGDVDLVGWDLRKTLKLLYKSNPALIEWLRSPHVYLQKGPLPGQIRRLLDKYTSLESLSHHYYSMAEGNYKKYLKGKEEVYAKKYFYAIRPLLCVRYIKGEKEAPPIRFEALRPWGPDYIQDDLEELLDVKRSGQEMQGVRPRPRLHAFIDNQLGEGRDFEHLRLERPSMDELDELYREALL